MKDQKINKLVEEKARTTSPEALQVENDMREVNDEITRFALLMGHDPKKYTFDRNEFIQSL